MRREERTTVTLSKNIKGRICRLAPYIIVGFILIISPAFIDRALVGLFTKIIIFALLVMALDLLVGYTGLLAFGHAAFFGVAAYTTGILIVHYNITSFWLAAPAGV